MRLLALLLCLTALTFATDQGVTKSERRLRREFDELTARAIAILDVVRNSEQQHADRGLSLHPDILAARNRVEAAMDDAEESLNAKDWWALKARLQRARGFVEQLQRKY